MTGFFYTRLDANHRPSKVLFHHPVGTDGSRNDRLIYEETDPGLLHECRRHALQRVDH